MSGRKPYSEFNLPSDHLPLKGEHARPASARKPAEVYFRRSRRRGTLVIDQQRKGAIAADRMIAPIARGEVDDGGWTVKMLAMASLNTSYYVFANGAPVMDKKLVLPVAVSEDDEGNEVSRATEQDFLDGAKSGMGESVQFASSLLEAFQGNREGVSTYRNLGKSLGNTSLLLGVVGETGNVEGLGAVDAQDYIRQHLMRMREESRTIATYMGSFPSLLQLADQDSDFRVYWRHNAPNEAFDLLQATMAQPDLVSQAKETAE